MTMTMTMTGHTGTPTTAYSLDTFGQAVRKIKLLTISHAITLAFPGYYGGVRKSAMVVHTYAGLTVRGVADQVTTKKPPYQYR